jgi:hypothetical protein
MSRKGKRNRKGTEMSAGFKRRLTKRDGTPSFSSLGSRIQGRHLCHGILYMGKNAPTSTRKGPVTMEESANDDDVDKEGVNK